MGVNLLSLYPSVNKLSFATLVRQFVLPSVFGSNLCSVGLPVLRSLGFSGFLPRIATQTISISECNPPLLPPAVKQLLLLWSAFIFRLVSKTKLSDISIEELEAEKTEILREWKELNGSSIQRTGPESLL